MVLFLNTLSSALLFAWILFVGKYTVFNCYDSHCNAIISLANFHGLPIEAMVAGPILNLIGGGDCVLMSTVLVYLTDMVGDSSRRFAMHADIHRLS